VVFCHVCGKAATPEILATVNLKMTDLFDTDESPASKLGPIVSDYRYVDENGNPVMRVTRHFPKTFRQWRPYGDKGGWLPGVEGVRKVLYHLNELKGNDVVFIVEGEKDVDKLNGIGVTATCNVGGASTWSQNYVIQLLDAGVKRVIIIPDNDTAGQKHAQEVASSCFNSGIKVKVLVLDGLQEKGDVSDWLDSGKSKDDLYSLVKGTEQYLPEPVSTTETITTIEQSLIGAVLRNADRIPTLSSDEFSEPLHRVVWQGIRDMYESDEPVLVSPLAHSIRGLMMKKWPAVDPIAYLTKCMDLLDANGGSWR